MTELLTYGGFKESKTGGRVPVFTNGAAMYSLYNPMRDAEAFTRAFDNSCGTGFIVVFGIGSGLHIMEIAEKNPQARILAVEHSKENIAFLKANARELEFFPQRVSLCALDELSQVLLSLYIPALHGTLRVLYQQAWKAAHPRDCAAGEKIIERVLMSAQNDYATQAHFGKIWHRNILENISTMINAFQGQFGKAENKTLTFPLHKEACVIAAGPSLDVSIKELARERENKFIIAADTAYSALIKKNIVPDAVVTIDGQAVSARHFFNARPHAQENTMLFADLGCNPVVPRLFFERGQKVVFTVNAHPLACLAASYARGKGAPKSFLPFVPSGAGTVTVSAAALASICGFSSVQFFGADFAFTRNKPYARGTYLESFFSSSSRMIPGETAFTALMFRGASCYAADKTLTTPLLLSYKKSLEALMESPPKPLGALTSRGNFLDGFFDWYAGQIALVMVNIQETDPLLIADPVLFSCLPLMAYQQSGRRLAGGPQTALSPPDKKDEIFFALKLALSATKRYTIE